MWPAILGAANSITGFLGSAKKVTDPLVGLKDLFGTGKDLFSAIYPGKAPGIPTPPDPMSSGADLKTFMDQAYPGTNSWDRLGSSGAGAYGSVQAADKESTRAYKLQKEQLKQNKEIATQNNEAQIISALGPSSPLAAKSMVDYFRNRFSTPEDYDTFTKQGREELPSKIRSHSYGSFPAGMRSSVDELSSMFEPLMKLGPVYKGQELFTEAHKAFARHSIEKLRARRHSVRPSTVMAYR